MLLSLMTTRSLTDHTIFAKSLEHVKLSLGQLALMESFVEDLLNLRQLSEGVFYIQNTTFNLIDTLDFVVNMFEIKSKMYGVKISYSFCPELEVSKSSLLMPSE